MSPHHLHRIFKAVTGVTPKAYADALRAHKVREALTAGQAVTEALHEAGFQAPSRFYERAQQRLGMTPRAFQSGGKDAVIHFAVAQCSLGAVLVAASPRGVCAISLGDDADALTREVQDRFPQAELIGADADFERLVAQVIGLVEMPATSHSLPLDVRGTAFQQRVWQTLCQIPAGQTRTYAQLAEMVGNPEGLGYGIVREQQALRPDLMFANIIVIGVLGLALNSTVLWLTGRLSPALSSEVVR